MHAIWQANVSEGALNGKETIEDIKPPAAGEETKTKNRTQVAIIY